MKLLFQIFIIALIFFNKSIAQIEFSFSGYAVNFPIYSTINEKLASTFGNVKQNQISDLTRLRFKPAVYLWDGARLNLGI